MIRDSYRQHGHAPSTSQYGTDDAGVAVQDGPDDLVDIIAFVDVDHEGGGACDEVRARIPRSMAVVLGQDLVRRYGPHPSEVSSG